MPEKAPRQLFAALGATAILLGDSVWAQDGVAGLELEEVVVAARRTQENLQEVPIAVTVVGSQALESRQMRNLFDLDKAVPGITVCCNEATVGFGQGLSFVRGVRGVLTYLGDVPINFSSSAAYFDAENVQVLKGPQGTLFGLSTNGGAIVIAPQKPTEDFGGYAEIGFGDYGRREATGVINLPVIAEKLLVRLAATYQKRDGYIRAVAEDIDLNNEDFKIVRMVATWRPSDRFENELLVNYYDSDSRPVWFVDVLPGRPSNLKDPSLTTLIYGDVARQYFAQQAALGPYKIPYTGFSDDTPGPYSKVKQWNVNDVITLKINDQLTLKNIFGYQRVSNLTYVSLIGFPIVNFPVDVLPNGTIVGPPKAAGATSDPPGPLVQYTDEVQLQGSLFDDKLKFTLGSFNAWNDTKRNDAIVYKQTFGGIGGTSGRAKSETHAVYAQGTYNLSGVAEGLSVTAGYRYSWDRLHRTINSFSAQGALVSAVDRRAKFSSPGYTVQLQYQATPSVMLFVNNSKGYSRGGFNNQSGLPPSLTQFEPETLNNFEGGIKSEFNLGNVPVRANLSAYYGKNDQMQLAVPQTFIDANTGEQKFESITQNAASGHIYGFEGDFAIAPLESLTLAFAMAYSRGKFDDYVSNGVDVSASKFILTPKFKYTANATYRLPVPATWGSVSLSAAYAHQSSTPVQLTVNPAPEDTIPSFHTLDLSAAWDDAFGMAGLRVMGYWNNVTKTVYSSGFTPGWDSLGWSGITPQLPRMYGVRIRYSFD
ncbi:MAG: TonB-dependent receptor [Dehalococcoidia bacterium]